MPKIKEVPTPTAAQVEGANASLRSRLAASIRLAKVADDEDDVALMQEDLDAYAHSFGTYIALGTTFDQDVLAGFAELRRLVAELNEDNREDNGGEDILTVRLPYFEHPFTREILRFDIPEPAAVVKGVARSGSDSTSTGSGGSDSHDHVNGTTTHGGAGGAYHGHYQVLDGGDDHTLHLKVVGKSSGDCCDVM